MKKTLLVVMMALGALVASGQVADKFRPVEVYYVDTAAERAGLIGKLMPGDLVFQRTPPELRTLKGGSGEAAGDWEVFGLQEALDAYGDVPGLSAAINAAKDRGNHTGTQALSTISDAGTMAGENAGEYLRSDTQFVDDMAFRTNGSTITTGVTMPQIGNVWRVNKAGNAPSDPVIADGGLRAASGTLLYIGNEVPTPNGKFSLSWEFSIQPSTQPLSLQSFGLPTIAIKNTEVIGLAGGIYPTGAIHINFDDYGNIRPSIFPSTALTRVDKYPNTNFTDGSTLQHGKRYTFNVTVEGDYLYITVLGKTYIWTHPDISTKVGATTHWYYEPGGDTSDGVTYARNVAYLHKIWANSPALDLEAANKPDGALRDAAGGRAKMTSVEVKDNNQDFKAGFGLPAWALRTRGNIIADGNIFMFPWANSGLKLVAFVTGYATNISQSPLNASLATLGSIGDLPLTTNGEMWEAKLTGTFGANSNTKRIKVTGAGWGDIFDSGDLTENGTTWVMTITRQYQSSSAKRWCVEFKTDAFSKSTSGSYNNAASIGLTIQATGTAVGDVTLNTLRQFAWVISQSL